MEHFPQFYALSICFQTLPPFLLWMALIPFPPEVNGTSLNKFPKKQQNSTSTLKIRLRTLLFWVGIHSAAAHAEMPDFLLPASLLPSFLFPLSRSSPSVFQLKQMDASNFSFPLKLCGPSLTTTQSQTPPPIFIFLNMDQRPQSRRAR